VGLNSLSVRAATASFACRCSTASVTTASFDGKWWSIAPRNDPAFCAINGKAQRGVERCSWDGTDPVRRIT